MEQKKNKNKKEYSEIIMNELPTFRIVKSVQTGDYITDHLEITLSGSDFEDVYAKGCDLLERFETQKAEEEEKKIERLKSQGWKQINF